MTFVNKSVLETFYPKRKKIIDIIFIAFYISNKEWYQVKVIFSNRFCFLFLKTCFGEYKANNFFFGIFEIKNMFG